MKNCIFRTQFMTFASILVTAVFCQAQNIPNNSTTPTGSVTPYLPPNFTAGIKVNSVRTIIPTLPVTNESNINIIDPNQSKVVTEYSDGIGRTVQTVKHFASPLQADLVTLNKYDNVGNEVYHFLPYSKAESSTTNNGKFKLTGFLDQKNFYKGSTLNYSNDFYFYSKINYEPSPLNRINKKLEQGNAWVGKDRGKSISENALPAGANIRIFSIAYAPGSLPVSNSVYNAGELWIKTTTDEDGYFTEEYTNKEKQVVLKTTGKAGNSLKLQTYYVYDNMGLLRYIIPPKAVVWLSNNSWTINTIIGSNLCFSIEYDYRSRPISKSKPGGGTDLFVYNQKDELVFSQTPLQRSKGQWIFNKYDILGRIIQSGVYNSTATQAMLHGYINSTYSGTDPLIQYINNNLTYGNTSYVTTFSTGKVLVTNYYDDYSFTSRSYDATYISKLPTANGWNNALSAETSSLLTGKKVVVLDGATTPTELLTVNYYNDRGLILQTQAQNHKGGWNFTTNCYDFLGQKLSTYLEINNPQATDNTKIKIIETYTYDHNGRLLEIYNSLNDATSIAVQRNSYDEIDRVTAKSFSNAESPAVSYDYNVRNWITGINRNYCVTAVGSETFGMEISYDYGYTTNYYNSSIAGIKWRNSGKNSELRSYGYVYDTYNRLKSADFVFKTGALSSSSTWSNATKDYTANNITYDENGNLRSMKQMGVNTAGQKIILDDLTYSYNSNSNRLITVSESSSSQSKDPNVFDNLGDFRDKILSVDYSYDVNGNLSSDLNKDLSLTYDEIVNKAKRVTKGSQNVDYLYDAAGNKLQKKVTGGSTNTTTDYLSNAVFVNNGLNFIKHIEGRIRYNSTATNKYMYDFYIKDNLGSTRSVVTYTNGAITGFSKSTDASNTSLVKYIATSEPSNAVKENQLFDNIDNTRSVKPINKTPEDGYVSRISSNSQKTILGPDITVRVMAGDTVKISAEALYIQEKNNVNSVTQSVVNSFISAFTATPIKLTEGLNSLANNNMKGMVNALLDMQNKESANGAPKAFLNYLLYDEHMNLVSTASGALQVKNKDGWQTLETDKIAIPENGFLRVFSSNMEATPVSINNTTLALISGKLVEEYNYYPYGLVFDQTQSASTIKKTDYLYSGKELQHNEFGVGNGIELVDYDARFYDPQIGRWNSIDPLSDRYSSWSPYNYNLCNPINYIDYDGRGPEKPIAMSTIEQKFNNGQAAKGYVFILYVDQPDGNSRDVKTGFSNVGHTFIQLVKLNADGTTTGAVFGFYPKSAATPMYPSDKGQMGDNNGHVYDVSLAKPINATQFNNILKLGENYENGNYDLQGKNCTDFGIDAAAKANIKLPDTQGTWSIPPLLIFQSGSNPADLGQDIIEQKNTISKDQGVLITVTVSPTADCTEYTTP